MGVTWSAVADGAARGGCAAVCGCELPEVVVHACVAARVRLNSATAAAVDRRRHVNIYDAT